MSRRRALDRELVRRGLAADGREAESLIEQGRVTVGGAPATNAGRLVDSGEAVVVATPPSRFVSRGGLKLDAALDRFSVDPHGSRVIDVGSSTGGFTDCVLQRGAAEVVAIDVGRNQLHERIRTDSRVAVHERTNVRDIDVASIGGPGDLVVADLSFISLRTVARSLISLAGTAGQMVLLVKPQFEASKAEADRGRGVITDPSVWLETMVRVCSSLEDAGAAIMGAMVSPITGGEGNVEFLVSARVGESSGIDPAECCAMAVRQAEDL